MRIADVEIGGNAPCRFVAEMSNNHNGSLSTAHRIIDAVATTGAEFVKMQAFTPDELVALRGDGPAPAQWGAAGWTMRDLYTKAQTPLAWLPELFQHAREVGLVPFSSVFGAESLAVLEAVDCPAYKIARLDNAQHWLADAAGAAGKPLLVSAAAGEWIAAWRRADGVLYCPPGYPTPPADVDLPDFGVEFLGLSSHCLDPRLPIAAVARGAKLLEFHVQLDDEPSELEANVSLTVSQFRQMVADVRATEALLG